MKQIPTVFVTKNGLVTNEITPGCEWVFQADSNAIPRKMYDGIGMLFDGEKWFWRRRVKKGKRLPDSFQLVDTSDEADYGWVSVEDSFSWYKHFANALKLPPLEADLRGTDGEYFEGTYELIGASIAGGKDGSLLHRLIRHDSTEAISNVPSGDTATFKEIQEAFHFVDIKGVVWYDATGRTAKLTKKDFGYEW